MIHLENMQGEVGEALGGYLPFVLMQIKGQMILI